MRIAHIIDPLIGVIPDVYLNEAQDEQWRLGRLRAFEQVCVSAVNNGAGAILITGRLFAENCASDEMVAKTLNIIKEQPFPTVWMPDRISAQRLRGRKDVPENLLLMSGGGKYDITLDGVRVIVWTEAAKLSGECGILLFDGTQAADAVTKAARAVFPELRYAACGSRVFVSDNGSFRAERLAKTEKTGFDERDESGYYLLSFESGRLADREKIGTGLYDFVTLQVNVQKDDDFAAVCEKCRLASAEASRSDLVRIVLNGTADAESFVRPERLHAELKDRFFYLEVFNNCRLDIDEKAYMSDISLDGEFVLGVLADDTLSESEKSRVIQCGRNALRGKELSE